MSANSAGAAIWAVRSQPDFLLCELKPSYGLRSRDLGWSKVNNEGPQGPAFKPYFLWEDAERSSQAEDHKERLAEAISRGLEPPHHLENLTRSLQQVRTWVWKGVLLGLQVEPIWLDHVSSVNADRDLGEGVEA